jgi:nicotinamidase-related amidase
MSAKVILTNLFSIFIALVATAGPKALVIIDMQEHFVTRNGDQEKGQNPAVLQTVIYKQKLLIDRAKQRNMPILLVEYSGIGPTNPELKNHIGDYAKVKTVLKNTDGLFNESNTGLAETKSILTQWGTKDLIIVGANGGACVEQTIAGALTAGFNVYAYTDGIADFNAESFAYPYSYLIHSNSLPTTDKKQLWIGVISKQGSSLVTPSRKDK